MEHAPEKWSLLLHQSWRLSKKTDYDNDIRQKQIVLKQTCIWAGEWRRAIWKLWMNRTSGRVCRYIFSRKQISRPIKFILHSLLESILSSGQSCRCVSSNSEKIVAQNSRLSDDLSFSNSWRIFLTRKIVCSCQFKNPKRIKRTEKITHEVEQFIAAGKKQRYTDLLTHRVSLTNQFYSKSLESISPTSETCWIRVK